MISILASTAPLSAISYPEYSLLLREAATLAQTSFRKGISLQVGDADGKRPRTVVWIFPLPVRAYTSVEEAAETLQSYSEDFAETSPLILPFQDSSVSRGDIQHGNGDSLVVASKLGSPVLSSVDLDVVSEFQGDGFGSGANSLLRAFWERTLPYLKPPANRWRVLRGLLLAVFLGAISFLALSDGTLSGGDEAGPPVADEPYIRYPMHSNSIGPKYQLRIQWHNASAWRHSHPHDNGEWAFRIDDQALVPAHLYDAAEDAYQQWFRARYPHMAQVVDGRDYIRPAWLGSREVAVEWDSTFHNAHCVLALRRYFWAKESGRHVCPRDIDPGHIGHCLDALDAAMFTVGPMAKHEPKRYMYWQTKVCFGEN